MLNESMVHRFLILAEEKNFSRAASKLYIAQQTLSKQISDMEKEIGFALFERSTRNVELTPLGLELQAFFSETSQRYTQILQKYDDTSTRRLKICCFEDMDLGRQLYEAKNLLSAQYPQITYRFLYLTRFQDILSGLENGEIDLAIIPDGVPLPSKSYAKRRLSGGKLFVCFSPKLCHGKPDPTIADLKDATFYVGSEENKGMAALSEACSKYGFTPILYSGEPLPPSVERLMIDGGAGAGLGGKHSILNRDSLLIKIELPASADICAVWKKSHADQILDAFINLLAQIVRRYDE